MQTSTARIFRRLIPLAFLIPALILGSQGATRAQSSPPTPTPSPTPSPSPTPAPSIDPTHFALSQWEFPRPAVLTASRVETTQASIAEPGVVHFGGAFSTEGRLTGYFMGSGTANFDKKGKQHVVYTYYLTSTFPSVDAASAAFNQQKSGWDALVTLPPSGTTAQLVAMSGNIGDAWSGGIYTETSKLSNGDVVDGSELFFQRGVYLVEVFQQNLHADATYGVAARPFVMTMAQKLDSVASGAAAGPPPPTIPTSTSLRILSTRFEPNKLKLDFTKDLGRAPLKHVAAGTTVQASTYFEVTSAPPSSHFTVHITISRGKTSVKRKYSYSFGAYPPGYYRQYFYNLTFRAPGRYKLKMKVSIGKVSKTGHATLKVTKKSLRVAARSLSHPDRHAVGETKGWESALDLLPVRLVPRR